MKIKLLILLAFVVNQAFSQFMMPMGGKIDIPNQPGLLWKYKVDGPVVGAPVIEDGTVFVGSLDSSLYALDLQTGKLKWEFPTGGAIRSSVCLMKQHLFLLSSDGLLYRLAKDSGRVDGVFKTNTGYMGDRQHDYADYFTSTPVIVDSTIYFGSGEYIYALSINDGYLRWSYMTGDQVHTKPAFDKRTLYAGSFDGNLYAIDLATGNLVWKFKTTGNYNFPKGEVMGNPVAAAGMVFAGARDYNFYAVDAKGGYTNWMKQFPLGWALPVTPNDTVIYLGTSDDRALIAIDIRSGREVWRISVGFNIFSGIAIGDKMGYFGTLAGKVHGINLTTGAIAWTAELASYKANQLSWLKPDDSYRDDIGKLVKTPLDMLKMYRELGGVFNTPAVDNDLIVVAGYDGWVYGLSGSVEPEKEKKK